MAAITGPFTERQVRIYRDSLSTPWGFRLQGGRDFKAPLTVQRVFVGSPAEGDLHRGDIISAIENRDVTSLIHKEAQDIIKSSGGSLSLRIRRGTVITPRSKTPPPSFPQSFRGRPYTDSVSPVSPAGSFGFTPKFAATASQSHVPTFGVDYTATQPQFGKPRQLPVRRNIASGQGMAVDDSMMHRIQQSLNDVIWQPHPEYEAEEDPYEAKPVSALRQHFNVPDPKPQKPVRRNPRPRQNPPSWVRSGSPPSLNDPGWVPKNLQTTWRPVHSSRPPLIKPTPSSTSFSHQPVHQHAQQSQDTSDGPSPWQGSLRAAGASKPWESNQRMAAPISPGGHKQVHFQPEQVPIHQPRVQNVHYAPGQAPQYQQQPDHASNDARVVHAQYNSPMGLYSRDNVEDALQGQTAGRPGQGTLQVQGTGPPKEFDPAKSSVLRMLQEESRGGRQPSGRQIASGQYDPYQQHEQQASAMQGYDARYNGREEVGASEF